MLRAKYENICIMPMMLGTLFWFCVLIACFPADAQERYYIVDASRTPGVVQKVENGRASVHFTRSKGNIHNVAVWGPHIFFSVVNEKTIYKKIGTNGEGVFSTQDHELSYIMNLAFDRDGFLYFSEKAGNDGRIYRLSTKIDDLGSNMSSNVTLWHTFQLGDGGMHGFWEGDFALDAQHNIYLSSGQHLTPGFIYEISRTGESYNHDPQMIYRDGRGAIKGIAMERDKPNFIYYSNWLKNIYRIDLGNQKALKSMFEFPIGYLAHWPSPNLSDIAFDMAP